MSKGPPEKRERVFLDALEFRNANHDNTNICVLKQPFKSMENF